MKNQCDVCNQVIENHLLKRKKALCFSCLTEELSAAGVVATFNLKEKPVQANCAVCEIEASGHDLFPAPWGFICRDCRDFCETQTGISWELVKVAAQREWLIKANNRIQGPHTFEEVVSRLLDNRLVSLDEAMRPLGRWHLLRDEEVFRSVLNEIKNKGHLKDRSLETTSSGITTDVDNQQTSTLDTLKEIPIATPAHVTSEPIGTPSVRDATPKSGPRTVLRPENSRDLIRNFAFKDDVRVQREMSRNSQRKTFVALGIFVVVGIFAAIKLTQPREGSSASRDRSFEELMESGLRSEKIGDYTRSLSLFNEARTLKPNDNELLLHLAPLTLIYDRQTLQAQRMFKEILDNEKGLNYQKAANLGLGLIALDSHELGNAEDFFNKAMTLDPDYIPAIVDRGVVAYYKGELENAESYLVKALTKGGPEGAVVITLADVSVAEVEAGGGKSSEHSNPLWQTHLMLDAFLSLERDYEQEVMVQDARLFDIMKRPADALKRIEALLDVDPEKSELHVRDWGIYRGRASWGLLLESLKKTIQDLPSNPRLTAALGLAMYRGHEKLDGAQSIEQALSQSPRDPLLMALAGWVEMKLGRREMGVVNIKEASLMPDRLKLPHILQARLCEEDKDFECARRHWKFVHDIDPKSVEALYGLALVEWNRRDVEDATSWLRQGQAMDPSYSPLLALSQEIQQATAARQGGGG